MFIPHFGSEETTVASLRRGQGLSCARHSWFKPDPMDPVQDRPEPISQAGGTSITHLRKVRNTREQRVKELWKHQGSRRRRGRRCSMHRSRGCPAAWRRDNSGAGVSLQTMEKAMTDQVSIPQHMEDAMLEQVYISWQELRLVETPLWSMFTLKNCGLWEVLTLEQRRVWRRKSSREEESWLTASPALLCCLGCGTDADELWVEERRGPWEKKWVRGNVLF